MSSDRDYAAEIEWSKRQGAENVQRKLNKNGILVKAVFVVADTKKKNSNSKKLEMIIGAREAVFRIGKHHRNNANHLIGEADIGSSEEKTETLLRRLAVFKTIAESLGAVCVRVVTNGGVAWIARAFTKIVTEDDAWLVQFGRDTADWNELRFRRWSARFKALTLNKSQMLQSLHLPQLVQKELKSLAICNFGK